MAKIRGLVQALSEGRKPLPVGTKRTWGGRDMIKTSTGWTPVSKAGWHPPAKVGKSWGKEYGLPYHTPEGEVKMQRKGQKVRFFNKAGQQIGPEQRNVAPAVAYAMSKNWRDHAPTVESLLNTFRVLSETVADTIWKQIPMSTKMAVGAREPASDGKTLKFKVLKGSFVAVTLDPSDTYTVEHYRIKRGSYDKVTMGKVSDVYAENLGSIVYGITHGKIK